MERFQDNIFTGSLAGFVSARQAAAPPPTFANASRRVTISNVRFFIKGISRTKLEKLIGANIVARENIQQAKGVDHFHANNI